MKFSEVLLVSDYDETLYDSRLGISGENLRAIDYFVDNGGKFTVSTGRSLRNFAIQMEREQLRLNVPAILSNGANVYDFSVESMLREELIHPAVLADMDALCVAFPSLGFEAYCRENVFVHRPNEVTNYHLKRAGLPAEERAILEMPVPWTKAILQHTDKGLLTAVQEYILRHWGGRYEAIFSNEVLLELTAKGSHKGSAVLWLAEQLGIDKAHLYCIGNGQNDLPMLAVSAEAFAPANCAPALRSVGATILSACDQRCLADLVAILDKRYTKKPRTAASF